MSLPRVRLQLRRPLVGATAATVGSVVALAVLPLPPALAETATLAFGIGLGTELALAVLILARRVRAGGLPPTEDMVLAGAALVATGLGVAEAPTIRDIAYHARCERYYHRAIAEGDPEPAECERGAETHARMRSEARREMLCPWERWSL